jgi:chaperone LolA
MNKLFAFLFLALAAFPACAEEVASPQQAVGQVEAYLAGIKTLKARFVQTDNEGKQLEGTFYLKRPGRMRIEYDPPVEDFIVADGLLVYYYDSEMKQQSNTPISNSLANFFLRKNLSLSGDISVSDVKREGDMISLTLTQAKNPLAGSLTLMLSQNPMQLRQWTVVDAQGLVTQVTLKEAETGIGLKSDLFHYVDPARQAPAYRK